MKTAKRIMLMLSITALLCCLLSVAAFAAGSGDVAGAVESTWTASGQIKSVVNKVVFPRHRHDSGYFLLREAGDGVF